MALQGIACAITQEKGVDVYPTIVMRVLMYHGTTLTCSCKPCKYVVF